MEFLLNFHRIVNLSLFGVPLKLAALTTGSQAEKPVLLSYLAVSCKKSTSLNHFVLAKK